MVIETFIMTNLINKLVFATVSASICTILMKANPALATSFSFSQSGFQSGGGMLTGTFAGTDLNNDNLIDLFNPGELTAFEATFSGSTEISLSHSLNDLSSFTYDFASGRLMFDSFSAPYSIAAQLGGEPKPSEVYISTTAFVPIYISSQAPGKVERILSTSRVPEPSIVVALNLLGLGCVGGRLKKRIASQKSA